MKTPHSKIKKSQTGLQPKSSSNHPTNSIFIGGYDMLANKPFFCKANEQNKRISNSPWMTHKHHSVFGYELSIAEDKTVHQYMGPHPFFEWIDKNKGGKLLFDALATCCPLFPTLGYKGVPALYIAPPPSGFPTAAFIVMGQDHTGKLRAVGSNYINTNQGSRNKSISGDFFATYDWLSDDSSRHDFIRTEVLNRMTSNERSLLKDATFTADKFNTMPVVVMALTKNGALFAIDSAMIRPYGSCDYAFEFTGEVV
jgi:hypothetical protein